MMIKTLYYPITDCLCIECSTHTHHGQIWCHNTDYVHVNRHDRTITVILAKHCIKLHSGNPTVSSVYLPTPRWHHLKAHPFLATHSADEHRMIYSFSNTTSYCTFYAFFPSFRITLWPMWLAKSKR